ncbi:serine/threonine-protein kinase [Nonomuraea sp. NPDC050536]|uniref:serine/threonine-protein kinase n=1 Tax=Nonomuraea sp. NPDC050536 TaxID=3364366 RepID=UPI0037C826B2
MNDDRLGPYRLLRRLGEGGMGVVHLAVDPQGRQVAVKVLRSEVAGDEVARRRLSREVETMRRVRSKYIAEVLDADVTGHRPYIVTRYVPGRPLDEIVKEDGPLDLPALIRIAHGVATALAAVHSVGVIHRDLKPGNVLILDGEPVLIDFGIAQAVDATRLTQTGMFIGTPGYLAPEIIEGQEAGPEVDIHAWAGTLLYSGTGQPPFGKGTLEMIFYNITAGKADVSAAPAALQPLLKAAFQRNPSKRPKAAELAEQTARMLPRSQTNVVDEISTVPRTDRTEPPAEMATPPVTPREQVHQPAPAPPAPQDQPFVSLLPGQDGDPWPTRRVTPEELRQMQREGTPASQPWPQANNHGHAMPPPESDVPTRRVRSDTPQPPSPYIPVQAQSQPHLQSQQHAQPHHQQQQHHQQQPMPDPRTRREPFIPGALPGQALQRSKAYGVAGAMLLIIMIVLATLAPTLVAIVAIPVAILLRAADLAQPALIARRSAGSAAVDVLRVLGHPQALAKSVGITLALVLYAAILGLPVTLLLTVVLKMEPHNALAWGVAIALWTLCAGPGVEGPSRQMRRTLSSLVPSRAAAMVMAGVFAAGAALSLILAYSTFGARPPREAIWAPVSVETLVTQLRGLNGSSGK